MRGLVLGALAIAGVSSVSDAQVRVGRDSASYTWRQEMTAGTTLRVFSASGRIDVSEATGSVAEVRLEKRPASRVQDIQLETIRDGQNWTLCSIFDDDTDCDRDGINNRSRRRWRDDDNGRLRANFTIKLPKGVRLQVGSGNGDVSVLGANAEVVATSGNGRVRVVTTAGGVEARSGNGDVSVEGATDRVEASSGNGRVSVATSTGPVSATSGNGDIDVRMATLRGGDDMEFRTGNGTIRVQLPADFTADIEADMGSGELHSDFPLSVRGRFTPHHIRATIGDGSRRVRMSSGNGDIELVKR